MNKKASEKISLEIALDGSCQTYRHEKSSTFELAQTPVVFGLPGLYHKAMSDPKILQAILDGQNGIREDIRRVEDKLSQTENRLTERIDKLGIQLAELSDDAPTIEEFDKLEKRVTKLENQIKN